MANNYFGSGSQIAQTHSNLGTINNNFGGTIDDGTDVRDILLLTNPENDREEMRWEKGERVPDTCDWILEHENFKKWMDSTSDSLWLIGNSGQGKSMIALHVIDKLEERFEGGPEVLLFFLCSRRDQQRNTATSVVRSLLWKLVSGQPHLAKYADKHLKKDVRARSLTSVPTLMGIFSWIISDPDLPQITCVLDGVDELLKNDQYEFLRALLTLQKKRTKVPFRFGLFLASRQVSGVELDPTYRIDIALEMSIGEDLRRYVDYKLRILSRIKNFDRVQKDVAEVHKQMSRNFPMDWSMYQRSGTAESSRCKDPGAPRNDA